MSTPQLRLVEILPGRESAAAPPLVLGPALGTTVGNLYGEMARLLPTETRVLGWELPGHGVGFPALDFSVAELALAVVESLESHEISGKFHYVGTSIGGAVGQHLVTDHPERLATLTLVATTDYFPDPVGWNERAELVAQAGTPTQVPVCAQAWFAPGFLGRHSQLATALLHDLQNAERFSYAAACRALAGFDLRNMAHTHDVPVLTVAGDQDSMTGPPQMEVLAQKLGVENFVIAQASHLVPVEAPEAVAQILTVHMGAEEGKS